MAVKKKSAKVLKFKAKGGGSRRKSKPTKAETVEVSGVDPTQPSLLAGNMPPTRDLLYHLGQIKGYQDKAKTASGMVTAAKKKAKEAGVDMQAVALALGFKRSDPLDIATMLRQLQVFMQEDGGPVQINLFEAKHGSIEDQASAEGWAAGKAGRTPDNARWPEGAPGHKEYMRRWNDAQKELIEGGASDSEGED